MTVGGYGDVPSREPLDIVMTSRHDFKDEAIIATFKLRLGLELGHQGGIFPAVE